jgi:hypothetical protein
MLTNHRPFRLGIAVLGLLFLVSLLRTSEGAARAPIPSRHEVSLPSAADPEPETPPGPSIPPEAPPPTAPEPPPVAPPAEPTVRERADDLARRFAASMVASSFEVSDAMKEEILAFVRLGETEANALMQAVYALEGGIKHGARMRAMFRTLPPPEGPALVVLLAEANPVTAARRRSEEAAKDLGSLLATLPTATAEVKLERFGTLPAETIRDPRMQTLLAEMARTDPEPRVRKFALFHLATQGAPGSLDLILAVVRDPARTLDERCAAGDFLYRSHLPDAELPSEESLLALYHDLDAEGRAGLLRPLVRIASSARVQAVVLEALGGEGVPVVNRSYAAMALEHLLNAMPAAERDDLGARAAHAVLSLDDRRRAEVVGPLLRPARLAAPLRDALAEMERTARPGGAVEAVLASRSSEIRALLEGM